MSTTAGSKHERQKPVKKVVVAVVVVAAKMSFDICHKGLDARITRCVGEM